MKRFIFWTALLLGTVVLSSCEKNNTDEPTQGNYKLQYTVRIITDNSNPLGRDEIISMVQNNLQPLNITLTQKSESVWGYEAEYPQQLTEAQAAFEVLDECDPIDDLDEMTNLRFYGTIEEDVRIVDGTKMVKWDNETYHYTLPAPNKYRYEIFRDAWDVKSFEIDESTPLSFADDFSSCVGQVKINDGNAIRLAYFSAEGVEIYRANSRTEIEAVIKYWIDPNKQLQATLTKLDGSSVSMPVTLVERAQ